MSYPIVVVQVTGEMREFRAAYETRPDGSRAYWKQPFGPGEELPKVPEPADDGLPFGPGTHVYTFQAPLYRLPDGQLVIDDDLPFGAAYEAPNDPADWTRHLASREYLEEHAPHRGIYMIKLPGPSFLGFWHSPDWWSTTHAETKGGWKVSGPLEALVVSPSISVYGYWHGWIGVNGTPPGHLSRDLDGRPY